MHRSVDFHIKSAQEASRSIIAQSHSEMSAYTEDEKMLEVGD
jgi:hypothetical protein